MAECYICKTELSDPSKIACPDCEEQLKARYEIKGGKDMEERKIIDPIQLVQGDAVPVRPGVPREVIEMLSMKGHSGGREDPAWQGHTREEVTRMRHQENIDDIKRVIQQNEGYLEAVDANIRELRHMFRRGEATRERETLMTAQAVGNLPAVRKSADVLDFV